VISSKLIVGRSVDQMAKRSLRFARQGNVDVRHWPTLQFLIDSGRKLMTADPLCLVFVPALAAVLRAAEDKKGAPLTEAEVCEIRDAATCIALPFSTALAMEEERGYPDLIAQDCWNEWQRLRSQ
jgi:hypothetical protein